MKDENVGGHMQGWFMRWFDVDNQMISNKDLALLRNKVVSKFIFVYGRLTIVSFIFLLLFFVLAYQFSFKEFTELKQTELQRAKISAEKLLREIELTSEEEANRFSAMTFSGLDHRQRSFTIAKLYSENVQVVSYVDLGTNVIDDFMPVAPSTKFRFTLSQEIRKNNPLVKYYGEGNRNTVFGLFSAPTEDSEHPLYVASPMLFGDETSAIVIITFSAKVLTEHMLDGQDLNLLFSNGHSLNHEGVRLKGVVLDSLKLVKDIEGGNSVGYINEGFKRVIYATISRPHASDEQHPLWFSFYEVIKPADVLDFAKYRFFTSLVLFVLFAFLNIVISYYYSSNKARKWLSQKEDSVRAMAFDCSEGLVIRDSDGIIVNVNQGIVDSTGYYKEQLIGTNLSLIDKDQITKDISSCAYRLAREKKQWRGEVVTYNKDTSQKTQLLIIGVSFEDNGDVAYYVESYADLTKIKKQETELRIAAVAFDTQNALVITDFEGIIQKVNTAFSQMTGYSEAEVIGKKPNLLNSGKHTPKFYQSMWNTLLDNGHWRGVIWNKRKDGSIYLELKVITAVKDDFGRITHFVSNGLDFTLQNELEQKLEKNAKTDELTQLYNRRCFDEMLRDQILLFRRYKNEFSIMILDLDYFKAINDNYGHDVGDDTLRWVAQTCRDCVRDTDTVFRWGGEEFVVLLPETDVYGLGIMSERLRKTIEDSQFEPKVTCSIGAAVFTAQDDKDSVLKRADDALYAAKVTRNSVKIAESVV
jgi:diguanylate cyclase (GGDEF)-like protein/PAS domain S-box-containing protein